MRLVRPVTTGFFTIAFSLLVLVLIPAQETAAQKRNSKFNAAPANSIEAAAMEFALSAEEIDTLIGKKADVLTADGKEEKGVEITRFYTGRDKSQVKSMEFQVENASRPKRFYAIKLSEMKVDDKTYRFLFLPSKKAAVIEDTAKRRDAIRDKLASVNHLLWEDATEEDQETHVKEYKEFLQKVGQHFSSLKMSFYETKYFLFYTDMPAQQVKPYLLQLDKMNELLGKAFGFQPGHNIWRGKAVIVAFVNEVAFLEFERKFYDRTEVPGTVVGLCHSHGDGKVIVSCHRGKDPNFFGAVLVHETAHGYIHRYRSTVHIPSWINEGIADWVAMMVVPSCKEIQRRQKQSALQLRQSQTFGGQFFAADHIASSQYGAASAMVQLMLKAGPAQFRLFFDGIKDGLTWQDSLQRAYGLTPEQLCQAYGKSIGIPFLSP